jgi:MOSC domain-containing protein YiiM
LIVRSVNIGERTSVLWKEKTIETGIFKHAVDQPIFLGSTDVANDHVIDRKHHGGIDKACYAYNLNHYPFWKERYPKVDMQHGAFGENLSIQGLNEHEILIGDQYQIGEAIVEVSQPRQPCMKLGVRFNDAKIIKEFLNEPYPGVYFRVIQEGKVQAGDPLVLINRVEHNLSVAQVFSLFGNSKRQDWAEKAILMDKLAERCKADIKRIYQL